MKIFRQLEGLDCFGQYTSPDVFLGLDVTVLLSMITTVTKQLRFKDTK